MAEIREDMTEQHIALENLKDKMDTIKITYIQKNQQDSRQTIRGQEESFGMKTER